MLSRLVLVIATVLLSLAGTAGTVSAAELVMFDDPGCIWCRRWLAEIGPSYPNTEEGRLAPLRRIDIRDQKKAGIALARPVTATPTFVLVHEEQEVGRLAGYAGSEFFYPQLGELLKKLPPQRPPLPTLRSTSCSAPHCAERRQQASRPHR